MNGRDDNDQIKIPKDNKLSAKYGKMKSFAEIILSPPLTNDVRLELVNLHCL